MKQSGSYLGDLRTVLAGHDFRRLLITRLVSQAGDGAFQVGLASLFFFSPERAATTEAAALAFAVTLLPYTLVGPFAGVLLDRWRRRQVLLRSNLVRAVMVVAVAGLVTQGLVGLPLYLVVLACLSVNRFFLAGLGASLPHVVPADRLVMANAVTPTAGTLAVLLGGGGAYGLRSVLGAGDRTDALVLVLAAVAYVGSAVAASRMSPDLLGPDSDARAHAPATVEHLAQIGRELALSARHVRERCPAFHGLAAIGAHRIAYGLSTIATILLCRNYFNAAADVDGGLALLAQVVAASGVGFAVAALVTPIAVRRLGKSGWITTCFVGAGATEYVFAAVVSVPALILGAFVLGLAAQGSKICVDAIVQQYVDDAFRGRVFAFYDVVFNAAFVAAALLAVLVVPQNGLSRWLYVAIASMYVATAVGYAAAARHTARRTARARRITGSAAANQALREQSVNR